MRLSIPFSYPEYIFSVMQSHLSQSANDLICLLLINDMSFLKPVLGSLPTVFIYQVNCASFGGGWARPSTRSSAGNGDGAGDGVDLTKAVADEASFDHDGTTRCERGRLLRAVVGAWRRILR